MEKLGTYDCVKKQKTLLLVKKYLLQIDRNNAKMSKIKQHPSVIVNDFVSNFFEKKFVIVVQSFINYQILCFYGDKNVNKVKGRCMILR